ncbi:MAG: hypothetical protein AAGC73_03635 [Verrucomicrobiota bacterium]
METSLDRSLLKEEADTAFRRLDAILLAYGIRHAAIRSTHCQRILRQAQGLREPTSSLESDAVNLLFEELEQGITRMHHSIEIEPDAAYRNRLLVSINRTNIAIENPEAILGLSKLNEEQCRTLAFAYKAQYVPELKRRSMGAPALRFEGIDGVTSGTTQIFANYPLFQKLAPALGAACLLLIVYLFAK